MRFNPFVVGDCHISRIEDIGLMNSGINAPAILHINVSALFYIMEKIPFMDWIK